jgi:hypothetical protein
MFNFAHPLQNNRFPVIYPKSEKALMKVLRGPFFPHRLNRDGSYDSICLACLATVGCGTLEELAKSDEEHVCDPSRLAERGPFLNQKRRH